MGKNYRGRERLEDKFTLQYVFHLSIGSSGLLAERNGSAKILSLGK